MPIDSSQKLAEQFIQSEVFNQLLQKLLLAFEQSELRRNFMQKVEDECRRNLHGNALGGVQVHGTPSEALRDPDRILAESEDALIGAFGELLGEETVRSISSGLLDTLKREYPETAPLPPSLPMLNGVSSSPGRPNGIIAGTSSVDRGQTLSPPALGLVQRLNATVHSSPRRNGRLSLLNGTSSIVTSPAPAPALPEDVSMEDVQLAGDSFRRISESEVVSTADAEILISLASRDNASSSEPGS